LEGRDAEGASVKRVDRRLQHKLVRKAALKGDVNKPHEDKLRGRTGNKSRDCSASAVQFSRLGEPWAVSEHLRPSLAI
jgi:hypothetical protein